LNAPEKLPLFALDTWSAQQLDEVERALSRWVACPAAAPAPAGLGDAMRYAVLDGGKRLRPLLVMAACEAIDGNPAAALRSACAVELIHAYSLVHDDMPCMDNDVLRRGKPTVHIRFGEAQALLAGDALQALAFEFLTPDDGSVDAATQARLCRMLAQAAGFQGMAGGQAIDLASVGLPLTSAQLHDMHRLKTGAFIAEVVRGGIQSVSHGQTEAAGALGLSKRQSMRMVVLPQALRVIIPPMTNQFLNLTKNSSLAVAVGYPDVVSIANTSLNQTGRAVECITIIMLIYLTLSLVTSAFMNWFNARAAIKER